MKKPGWEPSCSLAAVQARAGMYTQIRAFFFERKVLEVETPLLSSSTATDPLLDSIKLSANNGYGEQSYYLHTSPEFPMKRLLAAYKLPIFQICKTFRNGESGCRHNPEFTMLEWYRPSYSLSQLQDEAIALIENVCGPLMVETLTYREAFLRYLNIDPYSVDDVELDKIVKTKGGYCGEGLTKEDKLDLLLSVCIEPHLGMREGKLALTVLSEYPAAQASLAKVKIDKFGQQVAERFEIYINGLEIANAYFELCDANEQKQRFDADNFSRKTLGLDEVDIDQNLIAALDSGMPMSSGIALGLDRLLMIKLGVASIDEVLAFPISIA